MSQTPTDDTLTDEQYGDYDAKQHVDIDLTNYQYNEVVRQVLEYQLGPAIAWEYDGGMLFMWGDNLDQDLLRDLTDAINDYEQQMARDGHYQSAEAARAAASWVGRAEVVAPDD